MERRAPSNCRGSPVRIWSARLLSRRFLGQSDSRLMPRCRLAGENRVRKAVKGRAPFSRLVFYARRVIKKTGGDWRFSHRARVSFSNRSGGSNLLLSIGDREHRRSIRDANSFASPRGSKETPPRLTKAADASSAGRRGRVSVHGISGEACNPRQQVTRGGFSIPSSKNGQSARSALEKYRHASTRARGKQKREIHR